MKSIFKSKTAAASFLVALAGLWAPSREWIAANPAAATSIIGVVGIVLRLATKDKVVLFGSEE
jgi:peptidoglycan/LPS O-acetylase OafA/YrhL